MTPDGAARRGVAGWLPRGQRGRVRGRRPRLSLQGPEGTSCRFGASGGTVGTLL